MARKLAAVAVAEVPTNGHAAAELPSRPLRYRRHVQTGQSFHNAGDTEEKQDQRLRVIDHIFQYIPLDSGLRMMSLPGERWVIERHLASLYRIARFVGCEHDPVTWQRSSSWMFGGNRPHLRQFWIEEIGDHVDVWKRGRNMLFRCDAWRFLSKFTPSHWSKPGEFNKQCRHFNAIWLDCFSPLGSHSYGHMLRGIAGLARFEKGIACAFSFLLGRDDAAVSRVIDACPGETPLIRRAAYIKLVIEAAGASFEIDGSFSHRSFNDVGTVHIGTVLGVTRGIQ